MNCMQNAAAFWMASKYSGAAPIHSQHPWLALLLGPPVQGSRMPLKGWLCNITLCSLCLSFRHLSTEILSSSTPVSGSLLLPDRPPAPEALSNLQPPAHPPAQKVCRPPATLLADILYHDHIVIAIMIWLNGFVKLGSNHSCFYLLGQCCTSSPSPAAHGHFVCTGCCQRIGSISTEHIRAIYSVATECADSSSTHPSPPDISNSRLHYNHNCPLPSPPWQCKAALVGDPSAGELAAQLNLSPQEWVDHLLLVSSKPHPLPITHLAYPASHLPSTQGKRPPCCSFHSARVAEEVNANTNTPHRTFF